MFIKGGARKLRDFINRDIKYGDNKETLYKMKKEEFVLRNQLKVYGDLKDEIDKWFPQWIVSKKLRYPIKARRNLEFRFSKGDRCGLSNS